MKTMHRTISLLLVLCLCITIVPFVSVKSDAATAGDGTYTWPVSTSYSISTGYYYSSGKCHYGGDFPTPIGTEVYAVAGGTVILATDNGCQGSHGNVKSGKCPRGSACPAVINTGSSTGSYANWIIIDHGNNVYSLYAHLQTGSFRVSAGQTVQQGQQIACSGNAGNTASSWGNGAHLHMELRIGANTQKNGVDLSNYLTKINVTPSICACQTGFAGDYVCTASGNLNIHSGHGTGYSVVGSIPSGAAVCVTQASGLTASDWAHVEYNGVSGYASMEYLHVDLGTDFYGYITNTGHWKHVTNDGDNVSLRTETGAPNQVWHFQCQSDYRYKITSVYDGKCLDVVNGDASAGANVWVYWDNGADAQRWNVGGSPGAYFFVPQCSTKALDLTDDNGEDGANIRMWHYNGSSAQQFSVVKLDGYSQSCNCSASFEGNYTCAQTSGGVNIHYGHGSDYSVVGTIPAGAVVHVSRASGMNAGDWAHVEYNGISGYASMEQLHVDLGTGFYANIVHVSHGTYLTNDDPNVATHAASGGANQVWYFERWDDGGYKIRSVCDGKCLDVVSHGTENHTNVQVYEDWNNMAQRWDIAGADGRYILSARCAETVLDVDNNGWEEGTNVQMYSFNGTGAQLFAIKKLDDYDTTPPPYPTITFSSSTQDMNPGNYCLGESVTISWHAENSDSYWFQIRYDEDDSFVINEGGIYESYTFTPEKPGSYTVSMRSYNEAGDSGKISHSFRVRTVVGDTWVSDTPLGEEKKIFRAGTPLYYNYKLFDPATGDYLYTFSTMDFTVGLYILDPDLTVIAEQTFFNSDSNYMPFRCVTPGTYRMQVSLNGGVFYDTFTIYKTYTVSYDANGGENAPAAQEKSHGTDLTLHTQIPTRSGCTFLGWAESPDGEVPAYMPGDVYTADADLTLYAIWKSNAPTVAAAGWTGENQWTLTDDGVLTIFGTGNMKNYAYNGGQPWLGKGVDITSVVIEEGVTSVGSGAFRNLTTLESVTLPGTLTKMGEAAFYGSGLTSVEIPASLWTIQPYTFKNCANLISVKFNEGNLQKISDGAFYGTGLTELVLPDCLTILDIYAFKGCSKLTSITIGSGLKELREAVFYGTAIPTITVPKGITKIGPYAFKNCVSLETIDLPERLTSVGEASFYACTALKTVELSDAVTAIGNYAFRKCAAITELTFGDQLTTIGECAFYGCTGLTEIIIPDKVTTIKPYAFKTCTGLTVVTLGSEVATIGEGAFNTCTALKTIVFPASLTAIGDYCFSGSYNLWQLTFAGDAPAIGTGAFKGLNATAYYPGDNATWTSANMLNYGGTITWKAQ